MAKSPTTREAVLPALGEAFREHGFDGASMAVLQEATGLGRGSLYHFFPGGKEEMARAVLDDIDHWFRTRIFLPLRTAAASGSDEAQTAIVAMLEDVEAYFRSGRRACLPGAFAVNRERDRFADAVMTYFTEWVEALTEALRASGIVEARSRALRIVAAVQGGIVLTRAIDDTEVFAEILAGAADAANCRDAFRGGTRAGESTNTLAS